MSIISANKEAKRAARYAYEEKLVEMRTAEHNAMNEMLNVLRSSDRVMTAAQIKAFCTSSISTHEIAGNLLAMKNRHSRYADVYYAHGRKVPRVDIPTRDIEGKGEYIVAKGGGGKRKTVIAELDENNNIIPNSKREIILHEGLRYGIGKIK